jgi:regulator of sigma E protease
MNTLVDTIEAIVLFIVVLGGLVLFHEFGHFIVARLARVRVLEFGVGFPPRAKALGRGKASADEVAAWELRRDQRLEAAKDDPAMLEMLQGSPEEPPGTLYTLNWLPIGGFVRLEGEDGDDGVSDPRSFAAAKLPVKLVILFAGVAMNLVFAIAIFTSIAWFATPYVGVRIAAVAPESPASAAGLTGGDVLVSVDGTRYDFFGSYGDGSILDALYAHTGERVILGVQHADGQLSDISVTLRTKAEVDTGKGPLGVNGAKDGFESVFLDGLSGRPLPTAVSIGVSETTRWFGLILGGLGSLVGSIASNPTGAPPVSGPVGIATSLGDVFRNSGLIMTIYVAGILSANLALVNVLPFPPLDGGRIFVLLLKSIPRYGAKISLRAERLTYAIGFVALFGFLIWITVFDVIRGLGGGAK